MERIDKWPPIKHEDPDSLQEFYIYLMECDNYLDNANVYNQLQNPKELSNVTAKLPFKLRERWRRRAHDILQTHRNVKFNDLVSFISTEVSVMKQPVFVTIAGLSKPTQAKRSKILLTQTIPEKDIPTHSCSFRKAPNHHISKCRKLQAKSANEKSNFVKTAMVCFGCLNYGHTSRTCKHKLTCHICNFKHPSILHDPARSRKPELTTLKPTDDETGLNGATVCSTRTHALNLSSKVLPPVLACKFKLGGFKEKVINVALDSCSLDCWINLALLSSSGIKCTPRNITMTTMEGNNRSALVNVMHNVKLASINNDNSVIVPTVYYKTNSEWPFNRYDVPSNANIPDTLKHVPFNFVDSSIDMLIGSNVPELFKQYEFVQSADSGTFASLHLFEWALNGPVEVKNNITSLLCLKTNIHDAAQLNHKIETLFSQDFLRILAR